MVNEWDVVSEEPMDGGGLAPTPVDFPSIIRRAEASPINAVSPKGARSEMQVMPGTAKDPGFGVRPAANDTPEELDRVGVDYAAAMLERYGSPALAGAAYNAGPGALEGWLNRLGDPRKGEISEAEFIAQIPFPETNDYVQRVVQMSQGPQDDPYAIVSEEPIDPTAISAAPPGGDDPYAIVSEEPITAAPQAVADKPDFVRQEPGLLEPGNYKGDFAGTRSFEFTENGIFKETVLPQLTEGESDEAIIERYKQTGQHMGKFETPAAAEAFAAKQKPFKPIEQPDVEGVGAGAARAFIAGIGKKDPGPSFGELTMAAAERVPLHLKNMIGGAILAMDQAPVPYPIEQVNPFTGKLPPQVEEAYQGMLAAREKAVKDAGSTIGGKIAFAALKDLEESAPKDLDPLSIKGVYFNAIESGVPMLATVGASILTRSPAIGLAMMGSQVGLEQYSESAKNGRSPTQAALDGAFMAFAETAGEKIPLGIIIKEGGKFLPRTLKAAGAEGIQEMFTQVLQTGYSMGILNEKMTFGEATRAVIAAGLTGGVMGGTIAAATHPFVRGEGEPEKPRVEPTMERPGAPGEPPAGAAEQAPEPPPKPPTQPPKAEMPPKPRGKDWQALFDEEDNQIGWHNVKTGDVKRADLTQPPGEPSEEWIRETPPKETFTVPGTKPAQDVEAEMAQIEREAADLAKEKGKKSSGKRLPFDFKKTFPEPADEALREAGRPGFWDENPAETPEERTETLRAFHDEALRHFEEPINQLRAAQAYIDSGNDPATGKPPKNAKAKDRLDKEAKEAFTAAPEEFVNWWGAYADSFGVEAADVFQEHILRNYDTKTGLMRAALETRIADERADEARRMAQREGEGPVEPLPGLITPPARELAPGEKSGEDVMEPTTDEIVQMEADRAEEEAQEERFTPEPGWDKSIYAARAAAKGLRLEWYGKKFPDLVKDIGDYLVEREQPEAPEHPMAQDLDDYRQREFHLSAYQHNMAETQKRMDEALAGPKKPSKINLDTWKSQIERYKVDIAKAKAEQSDLEYKWPTIAKEAKSQRAAEDAEHDARRAREKVARDEHEAVMERGEVVLDTGKLLPAKAKKSSSNLAFMIVYDPQEARYTVPRISYNITSQAGGMGGSHANEFATLDEAKAYVTSYVERAMSGSWPDSAKRDALGLIASAKEQLAKIKHVARAPEGTKTNPVKRPETEEDIQPARDAVAKETTEAQREAGNYAKGHIENWNGLDITIETPKGTDRLGPEGEDGKPIWTNVNILADYGYIKRSIGADAKPNAPPNQQEKLDIYLGPNLKSDKVFVIDQYDPKTGKFDEHKAIAAVDTPEQAIAVYDAGYSDGSGPQRRKNGGLEMNVADFKRWIEEGDTTTAILPQAVDVSRETIEAPEKRPVKEPRKPVTDRRAPMPKMTDVGEAMAGKRAQAKAKVEKIEDLDKMLEQALDARDLRSRLAADATTGAHVFADFVSRSFVTFTEQEGKNQGGGRGKWRTPFRKTLEKRWEEKRETILENAAEYIGAMEILGDALAGAKNVEDIHAALKRLIVKEVQRPEGMSARVIATDWAQKTLRPYLHHYSWPNLWRLDEGLPHFRDDNTMPTRATPLVRPSIRIEDITRPGLPERRKAGKNVKAEDFRKTFGFRGVEFGNWVTGREGQAHVNAAYDALMDFAEIMGVPAKAISIGGKLGLAFGSRGSGFGSAHYEPDTNVINLTKTKGDGSLSHEWGHALDFNLRAGGVRVPAIDKEIEALVKRNREGTINSMELSDKVKPLQAEKKALLAAGQSARALLASVNGTLSHTWDVEGAIKMVDNLLTGRSHIRGRQGLGPLKTAEQYVDHLWQNEGWSAKLTTKFKRNAQELGKYWVRPEELWARSFESFIYDELAAKGQTSPYLVNGWVAEGQTTKEAGYRGTPYPAEEERANFALMWRGLLDQLEWNEDGSLKEKTYTPLPDSKQAVEEALKKIDIPKRWAELEREKRAKGQPGKLPEQGGRAPAGAPTTGVRGPEGGGEAGAEGPGPIGIDSELGQQPTSASEPGRASGETDQAGAERPPDGGVGRPEGVSPDEREGSLGDRAKRGIRGLNFRIAEDADYATGSPAQRIVKNIEAIRVALDLEKGGQLASREDQEQLAHYVGWGATGLAKIFDEGRGLDYGLIPYREQLKAMLTPEQFASARATTINAHYTSQDVVRGIWDGVTELGFTGSGNVLEPGMGIGNFMGMRPKGSDPKFIGVELDDVTGKIARALYPEARIFVQGFEDTALPEDSVDLVIGNVPFGDIRPADKMYNKGRPLSLHNYFIFKSLKLVKPGGVLALVTSRYTMDSQDKTARTMIRDAGGDLIGAIRLPNTAFKENAGTQVVTDILFIRKRKEGEPAGKPDWLEAKEFRVGTSPATVNQYFKDNPNMILGTNAVTRGMYREDEYTVTGTATGLREKIANAVQAMMEKSALRFDPEAGDVDTYDDLAPPPDTVKDNAFFERDGKLFQRVLQSSVPVELSDGQAGRVRLLIRLRDKAREILTAQRGEWEGKGTAPWVAPQKELGKLYAQFVKAFGYINQVQISRRTMPDGEVREYRRYPNMLAFRDDPDAALVSALERFDEEKNEGIKGPIFTDRVVEPTREILRVNTPDEALIASMNMKGIVDVPYMAKILGRQPSTFLNELKGRIFKNPATGAYEPSEVYLSGNVRGKLAFARDAAKGEPEWAENVKALEVVQPVDLKPSQIAVRMGTPWIPNSDVEGFISELLETEAIVEYVPKEATWHVRIAQEGTAPNTQTWSVNWTTSRAEGKSIARRGIDLIRDALNQKSTVISWQDSEGKTHTDMNATIVAQEKQNDIKERFSKWIWKDPERGARLSRFYNDNFNNLRVATFNGDHLTLPGSSSTIELRSTQKKAVWRYLVSGNTLLDHLVGAGKTFTAIAAAMEAKRIGLLSKPLFSVPNHMLEQFSREFMQLYPNASILVADERAFAGDNRRRFVARAAAGNWDAIIMTHSSFERVGMSAKFQADYIRDEIAEYADLIRAARETDTGGRSPTVKQLEAAKKRREEKLRELMQAKDKDRGLSFEEMGVDGIFVDEAHLFKNLEFATKITNMNPPSSQRAFDLYLKTKYIDKMTPGRGLMFMTGTPISNSMAEMYTMQRYLQPRGLAERGLSHFDAWASTFGDTVTQAEITPEGGKAMLKTRFARFRNIPELISMYRQFSDLVSKDDLIATGQVKLPKISGGGPKTIIVPASDALKAYIAEIGERAEAVRKREVTPDEDNMLLISTDGRKASLDLRVVDPAARKEKVRKASEVASNAARIYKAGAKEKHTQIIFCDMSVPSNVAYSIYRDIKEELVKKGVNANDVAFVQDANTDQKKANLFADVRAGRKRILLGSTEKMGIGTNVQDRLKALHHVDPSWRPSDIEQREGRIERQGNTNEEIDLFRYVTEGSFDAYMWQTVERKARFINQIKRGDPSVREAEDIDEQVLSFAEAKALAAGNPLILDKAKADSDVDRLSRLRGAHYDNIHEMEWQIHRLPGEIAGMEEARGRVKADHAAYLERKDKPHYTILGTVYEKRVDASKALADIIEKAWNLQKSKNEAQGRKRNAEIEDIPIGKMYGFPISVEVDGYYQPQAVIHGKMTDKVELDLQSLKLGAISRIENFFKSRPGEIDYRQAKIDTAKKKLVDFKELVKVPFEREDQYQAALKRQRKIDQALGLIEADPQPVAGAPEPDLPPRRSAGFILSEAPGEGLGLAPPARPPRDEGMLARRIVEGNSDLADDLGKFVAKKKAKTPAAVNVAIGDWLRAFGERTKTEAAVAYDPATQTVIAAETSGKDTYVNLRGKIEDALSKPDARIVFHHNHTMPYGLSFADLTLLDLPGLDWMIAHTTEGQWHAARLTPETRRAFADLDLTLWSSPSDILNKMLQESQNAQGRVGRSLIRERGLDRNLAVANFSHNFAVGLARAGLIDYRSSVVVPESLAATFDTMAQAGAEAIASPLKAIGVVNVSDRGTAPTQFADGIAEILGEDQGLAVEPRGGAGEGARPEGVGRGLERLRLPQAPPVIETGDGVTFTFSPEFEAKREQLAADLRAYLVNRNLPLAVRVADAIADPEGHEADGHFDITKNLITIALDTKDPFGTITHEVIHGLRNLGFFTKSEWATLEAAAKDKWKRTFDIVGKYYKPDVQTEETIAFAAQNYEPSNEFAKAGLATKVLQRVRNFFEGLRNFFRGRGFQTPEDIFKRIESGRIGKRGKAGPTRSEAKFALKPQPPAPFFSTLARTIEASKQEKASGIQWQAFIKNARGITKDETEWTGVNEWLESQQGPVTKQALLDFIRENNVQIEEVEKGRAPGDDEGPYPENIEDWLPDEERTIQPEGQRYYSEMAFDADDASVTFHYDQRGVVTRVNAIRAGRELGDFGDFIEAREAIHRDAGIVAEGGATKFESQTLPGGENYRELLLTLPQIGVPFDPAKVRIERNRRSTTQGDVTVFYGDHKVGTWDDPIVLNSVTKKYEGPNDAHWIDVMRRRYPGDRSLAIDALSGQFRSGHFDEANILAHVRFKDRADADGKRVLFIEEIQSDWHQKGRRQGYSVKETRSPVFSIFDDQGELVGTRPTLDQAQEFIRDKHGRRPAWNRDDQAPMDTTNWTIKEGEAIEKRTGVPDAPFKSTWHEIALKRMLRYAAENGYDRLAWTTGAQQAERYNLAKHVNSLRLTDNVSGGIGRPRMDGPFERGHLIAYGKRNEEAINRQIESRDDLAELVGAELADKLLAVTPVEGRSAGLGVRVREISGLDLTVGGEGMKGFYDRIVPQFLNRYAKKWDAKVGTTKIDTGKESEPSWTVAETHPQKKQGVIDVHSLDVTPAMRESVMEGQGLFARRMPPGANAFTMFTDSPQPSVVDYLRNSNLSLMERLKGAASLSAINASFDKWRVGFQDRYLKVARMQAAIEQMLGRPLTEEENAYLAEELSSGRKGAKLEDLFERQIRPLVLAMHERGISREELETFLYARHAPERNARINEINPKFREEGIAGSGMSDEDARGIMDEVDKTGRRADFDALAGMVDDVLAFALNTRVEAGLMSEEQAEAWRATYRDYVPLRGVAELDPEVEADRPRPGKGFDVKGKESHRAFGRQSPARDILAYAFMQAEEAIIRGENNRIGNAIYELAKAAPNENFWKVDKVAMRPVWIKARQEVQYWPVRRILAEDAPYTLSTKIDGQEHRITFNRNNPVARDLAQGLKGLGQDQISLLIRNFGAINRILSHVNTTLNPEFVITNAFRDAQTALSNIQAHGDIKGITKGTVKDYRKALVASSRSAFKAEPGKTLMPWMAKDQAEWDRWAQEFRENGGRVYFNQMEDVLELRKRLDGQMREIGTSKLNPIMAMKTLGRIIENTNIGVENAIRLSAYKNARERGFTPAKAASLAKNLTVNFNRRGSWGPLMNSLYLFYNASIQGTATLLTAWKSPRVRKVAAFAVLTGFLLDFLNAFVSDEDDDGQLLYDKVTPFDKSRNLIVMTPSEGGVAAKIPLPYGYNIFYGVGRSIAEVMRGKDPLESAGNLAITIMDSFNPVGGAQNLLNMIAPTTMDPVVDLFMNKDYAGRPIAPEQSQYGPQVPNSQRYWNSVSPAYKAVTDFLSTASGGTGVEPGLIEISPEWLDYGFGVAWGAAGTFYERNFLDLPMKFADPTSTITFNDIPFVRRVVTSKPPWIDKATFYERINKIEQSRAYARDYQREGRRPEARGFVQENRAMLSLYNDANNARTELSEIRASRAQAKMALEQGRMARPRYNEQVRILNEAEERIIRMFNAEYLERTRRRP